MSYGRRSRRIPIRDGQLRNVLLILGAVLIVALLWGPLWFLSQLVLFVLVVYIVYQLLKGRL